jgi:hypothetical protein
MNYPHNYLFVCTSAGADFVRDGFTVVGECSADANPATSQNVRAGLVPVGSPPGTAPTRYRIDFHATESTRLWMSGVEDAGGVPGDGSVLFWRLDRAGNLQYTPVPGFEAYVGQPFGWGVVLTALGLQVAVPAIG